MEATPKKNPAGKPAARPAVRKPARPSGGPRAATAHKPAAPKPVPAVEQATPVEKPVTAKVPHGKSFYAVGRRKTAVAQVLITQGNGTITVNQLPFESYFMTADLQHIVKQPLATVGLEKTLNVKGKVHGGGIHAQAEGMRHAIARGLVSMDPEARRTVKKLGFLKRDPRVKERKKPGLKRARRAPQFSKR